MKNRTIATIATLAALGTTPALVNGQAFGEAVAVGNGEIFVGAASSEREPGKVHVYRVGSSGWIEARQVSVGAVRESFGAALAVTPSHLIVGQPGSDDGGRIFVYDYPSSADWGEPVALSEMTGTGLGRRIAASDGRILGSMTDGTSDRPMVVVWERDDDGGWEVTARLVSPAPDAEDGFGSALDTEGTLAVVGARRTDGESGAVYVFERGSDGWNRVARLTPPAERAERAQFGMSVAVADGELFVGAPGTARTAGAVYRYTGSGADWTLAETLRPEGLTAPAAFGAAIDIEGDRGLVGAPAVGRGLGRVFPLRRSAGTWSIGEGIALEGEGQVQAGGVLAVGDGVAVAGVPRDDFGAGSAWVVTEDAAPTRLAPEQVGLAAIVGGRVDCADGVAEGFDCEEVDLLSFLPREQLGAGRGARLNDVWGWTDPITGREYALVGRMDGTAFVDVTDPLQPRYLGNLAKTEGSQSNTWRDMKVFKDHMFVVADGAGQHGMQVFDLTKLRDVTTPEEFEADALYDGIASSHNIAINETTGFAYLVGSSGGGETCGGGSHIVDINDPLDPTFAGCFAHANTGRRNTGNTHDTQCVIYHGPDEDYVGREICMNANETALSIADVTDKDNPVAVAQATYPNVSYAHQGWLTEDHEYFYSNDELDEVSGAVEGTRTLVWDVRDLDDPLLVQEYYSPTRVTDHNLYVRGDRLYMSNNRAGLRVLDISDPENPIEAGSFDTTPWSEDAAGFDGTWSVYPYFESGTLLLSSRREGLFLVRPRTERLVP
ncbi:MAG: choice-of-anchor B family protein [Gemmatimonadetes bacterium]|nr:choice-of-anchor B family protein [Gemmatimonadota bacterium]